VLFKEGEGIHIFVKSMQGAEVILSVG